MKAIWDEVRLAFRLTFVDGSAVLKQGKRHHAGWLGDPHLLKGALFGFPIFAVWAPIALVLFWFTARHNPWSMLLYLLPGSLLANVVWFAVAVRSRAKG